MRVFGAFDFLLMVQALGWTLILSCLAFVGGGVLGGGLALMATGRNRLIRFLARLYIEIVQGIPLLLLLFLCFFGLSLVGIDLPTLGAAALALTINAAAFLGEIWRGALDSIPAGQHDAARALGLAPRHRLRYVLLPQAIRIAIPPTVGYMVAIIKHTALASVIGLIELTRRSQLINNSTLQPFLVFGLAALLYYVLCSPLTRASRYLEGRYGAR
jgi:polar amino acid transport system permease protein